MEPQRLSIAVDDIQERVRFRLAKGKPANKIVWADGGDELLLYLDALRCACTEGWLVCELAVEAASGGRQELHCVYFVGRDDEADGTRAAGSVRPSGAGGEAIADRWGRALLRVIWDGVLDVIEGAVVHASRRGGELSLLGYSCSSAEFHVDVAGGS